MNARNTTYALLCGTALALLAASCDKGTEIREIWEDRYTDQKTDTVAVIDNYYLDGHVVLTADALGDGRPFGPVTLFLDGDDLFVANAGGGSVELFDARTLKHKRSYGNERTQARDVCAEGDHLFVAGGVNREVQLFDRHTGDYLTRLGTGSLGGNVSWAGNVAASRRFVFVRDSKERNVRVFDRETLSTAAAANNTVFARLSTDDYFLGHGEQPQTDPYDMAVIGDSLYAFLYQPDPALIYAWSLADIGSLKDAAPCTRTTLPSGRKIYSVAGNGEKVWVAMYRDGQPVLGEFTPEDFRRRDFERPLRSFTDDSRLRFPDRPMIAFHDERLLFPNGDRLEQWSIRNTPSYVLRPLAE